MEEEFVTYAQALTLKELGFDERCLIKSEHTKKCVEKERPGGCQLHNLHCGYPDCTIDKTITPIPLPLKQQVFRWFREKHECYANLSSWIHEEELGIYHEFEIYKVKQYSHGSIRFKTYEEAENACIDKLISIAQEHGKD